MDLKDTPSEPDKYAFGFTAQDVEVAITALRENIEYLENALSNPDYAREKPKIEESLPKTQREFSTLTSVSPAEILEKLRVIHRKTRSFIQGDETKAEQIPEIRAEFPDLLDYRSLLDKKPWGYRLGQKIMHAKMLGQWE